jgi:hypothetical protein
MRAEAGFSGRFLRNKANFAARLPDGTITVAAPHKTAYFTGTTASW